MQTFIYTTNTDNLPRGYNIEVVVYRVTNNVPKEVGFEQYNTASWKGERAAASNIIAKKLDYKITDGYMLDKERNNQLQLFNII